MAPKKCHTDDEKKAYVHNANRERVSCTITCVMWMLYARVYMDEHK